MKKFAAFLTLVLSLTLTAEAYAAGACYTPQEFEAEQGLRIHSELMVIALTCIKMPGGGQQMFTKYQAFTKKNERTLEGYESDLINYYRRQGSKHAEVDFHSVRTGLANKISKTAISMSTASFCNRYASHIDQALAMDPSKFRRWAQHPEAMNPTSRPLCTRQAAK